MQASASASCGAEAVRSDEDEDDKEEDDPPFAWLLPLLLLTVMLALSWCLACSSRWPARSLSTCSARRRALPLTDTSKASRRPTVPSEATRRGDRIDGAPDEDEDEDDEKEKEESSAPLSGGSECSRQGQADVVVVFDVVRC